MPHRLISYFEQYGTLSDQEKEAILEDINVQHFKRNSFLLGEGDYFRQTFFVLEGCVRQYYLVDGVEKTTNFYTENQWIINTVSTEEGGPVNFFLKCIEDSSFVLGDAERSSKLLEEFPKFQDLSRSAIENQFARQMKLTEVLLTKTPEQRYQYILEEETSLISRVPLYQLASYIGITAESLSRIRKRLSKEK